MNEGIKKNIKREIKYWQDYLTEKQETLSEDEINKVLEKLGSLYELLELLE